MVSISNLCLFFFLFRFKAVNSWPLKTNNQKIVIDHDGGADDAMALFISLLYEKYFEGPKVVALTTVNGNVNESQAFINTQRILNDVNRMDVPIFRGSKEALVISEPTDRFFGNDGLGDLEDVSYESIKAKSFHAALALITLSKIYKDQLTVVSLGPLSNIALAIKLDPGFIGRIKHLYVGAGHIYNEDIPFTTKPEFNVFLDVESYRILADHALREKVTVVPYSQVLQFLPVTRDWRINELGSVPTETIEALNQYERVSLPKSDLWQLLDPVVMSVVLDNTIIDEIRAARGDVILREDGTGAHQRGTTTFDFDSDEENMNVIYSASKEKYENFLLKVFLSDVTDIQSECIQRVQVN